jgi:hypothetical protein
MDDTHIQTLWCEYISTGRRNVCQPNEKWGRHMKRSKAENGTHSLTVTDKDYSKCIYLKTERGNLN